VVPYETKVEKRGEVKGFIIPKRIEEEGTSKADKLGPICSLNNRAIFSSFCFHLPDTSLEHVIIEDGSCAHTSIFARSCRNAYRLCRMTGLLVHRISIPSKLFGLCSRNASKIEQETWIKFGVKGSRSS
jgi:hypothetical protein